MKLLSFLCLIVMLTAGWMRVYFGARELFNGNGDLKAEISHLQNLTEEMKTATAVEREQFTEFRQNVATLMPNVLKENGIGLEGYPIRSLASTISRSESQMVRETIAKTLFQRGKEYFRKGEYAKAKGLFHQIIDRFGFTPFVAESYFLLAESHFQQNELEACTGIVQQMVELFPQHELTGFALIRLGRVYQLENRNEEAIDIYKTVLRSYPQRDVASQAKASLKGIDL